MNGREEGKRLWTNTCLSQKTHNICERGQGRTYTYVFMLRLCRLAIFLERVSGEDETKFK